MEELQTKGPSVIVSSQQTEYPMKYTPIKRTSQKLDLTFYQAKLNNSFDIQDRQRNAVSKQESYTSNKQNRVPLFMKFIN